MYTFSYLRIYSQIFIDAIFLFYFTDDSASFCLSFTRFFILHIFPFQTHFFLTPFLSLLFSSKLTPSTLPNSSSLLPAASLSLTLTSHSVLLRFLLQRHFFLVARLPFSQILSCRRLLLLLHFYLLLTFSLSSLLFFSKKNHSFFVSFHIFFLLLFHSFRLFL